jgi:acyl-CoA synthetase (AMP-forming)/AMP-acid ligase II
MPTDPRSDLRNSGDLLHPCIDADEPVLVDLSRQPPRTLTRAQLSRLSDGFAHFLQQRGLARGARVAIVAGNRAEHLAACFGIQRAGGVAVPINIKLPAAQVAALLADCGAWLVFTDSARRALLPGGIEIVEFDTPGVPSAAALHELPAASFDTVQPEPGEAALILYTSGSSGHPKGVVLSHDSQLWTARKRAASGAMRGERLLVAAPLYHTNALALAQLACLAGATVVLMPGFDSRVYIAAIAAHRCTGLTAVPPMMAMMLRERRALDAADLSSVRWIRMGSAPVTAALLQALEQRFALARVLIAYGTTEAGPVVFAPPPQDRPWPPLALGVADVDVQLRLVDAQGEEADEGILQIRTPARMTRYHRALELTARAFTDDGYYITGDIFQRDIDGCYTFVGRADDMFVCGGENIYPAEVQRVLESHPAVEQAAVVAVDDEIKGAKPVAFVVLRAGASASEDSLRRHALAHAPAYMHPRNIWILPALPLAGTQKIDRQALARVALQQLTPPPTPWLLVYP